MAFLLSTRNVSREVQQYGGIVVHERLGWAGYPGFLNFASSKTVWPNKSIERTLVPLKPGSGQDHNVRGNQALPVGTVIDRRLGANHKRTLNFGIAVNHEIEFVWILIAAEVQGELRTGNHGHFTRRRQRLGITVRRRC